MSVANATTVPFEIRNTAYSAPFCLLPNELLRRIFSLLDRIDLQKIAPVNSLTRIFAVLAGRDLTIETYTPAIRVLQDCVGMTSSPYLNQCNSLKELEVKIERYKCSTLFFFANNTKYSDLLALQSVFSANPELHQHRPWIFAVMKAYLNTVCSKNWCDFTIDKQMVEALLKCDAEKFEHLAFDHVKDEQFLYKYVLDATFVVRALCILGKKDKAKILASENLKGKDYELARIHFEEKVLESALVIQKMQQAVEYALKGNLKKAEELAKNTLFGNLFQADFGNRLDAFLFYRTGGLADILKKVFFYNGQPSVANELFVHLDNELQNAIS